MPPWPEPTKNPNKTYQYLAGQLHVPSSEAFLEPWKACCWRWASFVEIKLSLKTQPVCVVIRWVSFYSLVIYTKKIVRSRHQYWIGSRSFVPSLVTTGWQCPWDLSKLAIESPSRQEEFIGYDCQRLRWNTEELWPIHANWFWFQLRAFIQQHPWRSGYFAF